MDLKILNSENSILPPQNNGDAGFDIVANSDPRVIGSIYQGINYTAISHIEYNCSMSIEPEKIDDKYSFFMLLYPRSSIIKTNLSLANSVGVIDSGYRGNIKVCFKYIMQPEDMKVIEGKSFSGKKASGIVASVNPQRIYQKGDRIAQLIPCKHNELTLNYVKELSESQRGNGGFGSTGS